MRVSTIVKNKAVFAGLTGLCGMAWIGTSLAAISDDRQAVMKDVLANIKALTAIAKSGQFDAAEVNKRASAVAADLEKFKDLFPAGSEKADDKALPPIWTDRAGFEAARNKARDAAINLASSKDLDSFKAAFQTLGAGCKNCHDTYRAQQ